MRKVVSDGAYAPSDLAFASKAAGLKINTSTVEVSGNILNPAASLLGFSSEIDDEGNAMYLIDTLGRKVDVKGVCANWCGRLPMLRF